MSEFVITGSGEGSTDGDWTSDHERRLLRFGVSIRGWLDKKGFDWETAKIVVQDNIAGERLISMNDPILDKSFLAYCDLPARFVASDKDAVYFPAEYDCNLWCCKVYKDIDRYLDADKFPSPFPAYSDS